METTPLLSESKETSLNNSEEKIKGNEPTKEKTPKVYSTNDTEEQIEIEENVDAGGVVSNTGSMMHLIKCNVGTGILAMPAAISKAGLWTGFVGLAIIGTIAVHCMHLLIQTSHKLCQKTESNSLDYGKVAEKAFEFGPKKFNKFAKAARRTINVFICITQFGFCIVYVLFIAQNVQQFVEHFAPWRLCVQLYELMLLALLIPFSFIKSLKYLAPFSSFANVITFLGLFVILEYCIQDMPDMTQYPAFNSWATLPMFFGIAIYAFEGIAVVLPVENSMRTPESLRGLTGVLNTAMVIVTVMYIAVGFYGYLEFGDAVKGSVTLNLPNKPLYLVVKLLFAVSIFISYGLQFYVPAQVVFPSVAERCMPSLHPYSADKIIRVVCVVATFLLAAVIPHLDLMISLIGALASSGLALIAPPMLELLTEEEPSTLLIVKDVCIMILGLMGFFFGTAVTVANIINTLGDGGSGGMCLRSGQ